MNPEILILHLEDSDPDAELIRERITDEGLNVRIDRAASAPEFETFLQHGTYDLILADYHVPGLEGPESLNRVLTLCPDTPYICVSGAIGEECAVELLRRGATDYVSKLRINSLAHAIRRALQEAREHRAHLQAEVELWESQARYQRITEGLTDYLYTVRVEDGRAVQTKQSEACLTVTGYTAAEFDADPYLWFRMVAPEHRELIRESVQQVLAGQTIPPFEHRMLHKDGVERWVSHVIIVHRNASGKLLSYDGVVKDITERKQFEEVQAFLAQTSQGTIQEPFFQVLARFLARNLGMDFVCIDRLEGDGLTARTVAVWCDGKFEDNVTYALKDTPCGEVVGKAVCCFPASVCQYFPRDQVLHELRAESYVGVTLWNHTGQPIGLIAVIGHHPLANRSRAEATLQLVAVRAAGELERLDVEETLRESEARFRGAFQHSAIGMALVSLSGKWLKVNARVCAIVGYSEAELLTKTFQDITHPDDLEMDLNHVRQMLEGKIETYTIKKRYVHQQGNIVWVQLSVALVKNSADAPTYFVLQIEDITERKQAETELLRSKAELNAIYDHAPIIMCLLDEERRVVRVNRIGVQMANRPVSEMSGLHYGELLGCINYQDDPRGCGHGPECGACPMRKIVQDTIHTGHEHMGEEVQLPLTRGQAAQHLSVIICTARLDIEGQPRILLCMEDITERKHLEGQLRQAQKLEAIGLLAGGVAHDFNNIIASTMMHLGLLRDNPNLDRETQQDLKDLEVDTARAASLTRQLLAFGRRSMLDIKVQDLNDIIANLLKMLRRLIGEHIEVQFNGKSTLPQVAVDTGMMEQVVMNLTVNARDAMPNGGQIAIVTQTVEVTSAGLREHPERKPGRFVCLTISDTGCGMDAETQKRIFEPFFTTKEVGKGTGLGLATVYGIIAQHQGWVEVESLVGRGTIFRIYIPATQTVAAESNDTKPGVLMPGGNETILMVEDEPNLRRVTSMRLRRFGYRVLEASHGQDALTQWETISSQVDMLFTDMVMPGGLSGLDLVENLRKTKPALKAIISSGYSSILTHSSTPGKNGVVFLPKPYDSVALAKTVRDCLDGKGRS